MELGTSANGPMLSGQLARMVGVSPDTLRYYERCRLLPPAPRSSSRHRLFPPETVARVKLIRGAFGFSAGELAAIFHERGSGGAPRRRVRELAAEKLAAVEAHVLELDTWRRGLRQMLGRWDRRPHKARRGRRAGLLEALVAGGRVVISTADKEAVAAIRSFLRFQIEEHKTRDPTEVR